MIEENNTININVSSDSSLTGIVSSNSNLKTNVEGKGDEGKQGPPGITYIPEIESISTLSPGAEASVSVRIENNKMLFSFGIPQGSPGTGDMLKSRYDSNDDGVVDNANHANSADTATNSVNSNHATTSDSALVANHASTSDSASFASSSSTSNSSSLLDDLSKQDVLNLVDNVDQKFSGYVKYDLVESGEWVYKKYEDGTITMWHRHVGNYSFYNQPYGSSTYWSNTIDFTYPVPLKKIFSRHSDVSADSHLVNCNYSNAHPELTKYCLFLYDLGQYVANQDITIYTEINGRWKDVE